ncbi:nickel ABC transporter permease [Pseudothermotoga thermarum]|uniref:Binding-protein-dependent transport systems inner membrane component n=1 Tax=Pseudothermotoga thermarum DSM 5069 TaxID=688269 RepID=F7YTT6_9THEM|nr:nickel ABC transporter permease [Pseudothermotoga thermarum]AEH51381.1 binding-protein-dependent transport systems inner membrane component [Pseudothermotoga thermarum DSM 5069]
MLSYIVRRLILAIPVLLGVSLITFILLNVVPGDPVLEMVGKHADPATIERIRKQLGLDDPIIVQFGRFIFNAMRGDLGRSFKTNQPVMKMIMDTFPTTVKLALTSASVAIVIGIIVGIISAVKQDTIFDHTARIIALAGISAPVFWVAVVFQLIFGLKLKWFPISGYGTWKHMILPAFVLGIRFAASIARYTRSTLLDVIRQDYIRTARAKGLSERAVIFGHALKNALIPVVTIIGMQIGGLLTGSFLVETIFAIPGLGRLSILALSNRDYPLVQGTVLFTAVVYTLANLIVDISYAFLDPRVRLQ